MYSIQRIEIHSAKFSYLWSHFFILVILWYHTEKEVWLKCGFICDAVTAKLSAPELQFGCYSSSSNHDMKSNTDIVDQTYSLTNILFTTWRSSLKPYLYIYIVEFDPLKILDGWKRRTFLFFPWSSVGYHTEYLYI